MAITALIVWQYGGNLGHIARLLPIAAALRQRGAHVVFAVRDVDVAQRYLAPLGYAWCVGPQVPAMLQAAHAPVNQAEMFLRMGFAHQAHALACVERWMQLFAALRPGAVLVDESPLALYAAKAAVVPCLAIGHGFEIPPPVPVGPCLTPWIEGAQDTCERTEAHLQECLENMARGMAPRAAAHAPASLGQLFDPATSILCTWPELDHFDRDVPSDAYSGPIWGEFIHAARIAWPERPGRKVLCYLNVEDKRHDLLWQALAQHHRANVLVISPAGVPKACEAARGWGIAVVEQTCLLGPLLDRCDAVIGHGGMGLTSMALHAAKPLLLLPQHMEQVVLAYRLCKRGLALAKLRHQHRAGVREKCAQLLDGPQPAREVIAFAQRRSGFAPVQAAHDVAGRLIQLGEET